MTDDEHALRPKTFERLREQLATAGALCDSRQLLMLADDLHDAIRRRRAPRGDSSARIGEHRFH